MEQVNDDNDNEEVGNEFVFEDYLTLNWATVYEASGLGKPITYTRTQTTGKRKKPSSGVLLLDLPMILKKVQVQLQPQQGRAKRIFKLRLRMNCMITLIMSLKNYLTLTRLFLKEKRRDMPH